MSKIKKIKIKQILYIFLIIIWMSIVFAFSNQPSESSSKQSGTITKKVVAVIEEHIQIENIEKFSETVEVIVRKCAHFTLYLLGGFLMFNFINTINCMSNREKLMMSIMLIAMYACTDEAHQYFVEGRACLVTDVVIDTCGATVGAGINEVARIMKAKLTSKKLLEE
jgi:VanZ family protein